MIGRLAAMADRAVPERLRWAVERLAVGPADRLLEIGCGLGVSVSLVCERLRTGRIVAIDRSAKMTAVAARRNADQVAAGKAEFRTLSLAGADFGDERFDKVFAVNVNLFWTRSPATELALIGRLLRPGGALYLCYEPPSAARADQLVDTLTAQLVEHGYETVVSTGVTSTSASLVCATARPRQG
jgi:ubiquinone/menaquinone biosynthesis C-methylase UbiE